MDTIYVLFILTALIGMIAIIVIVTVYAVYASNKKIIAPLERQALKRNGTLDTRAKLNESALQSPISKYAEYKKCPQLTFKYKGFIIKISLRTTLYRYRTMIAPDWQITKIDAFYNFKTPLNLKIIQRKAIVNFKRLYFTSSEKVDDNNIILGNEQFDGEFVVIGDNEQFAKDFITKMIQDKLLKSKSMWLGIIFDKDKFSIKMPRFTTSDKIYDELIDITFMFYDRLEELKL